jgi:ferredoxin
MNEILLKGKIYKLVCIWRKDKNDKSKDIRGKLFSYPKENKPWSGQKQFISKLEEIETFLTKNKKIISLPDKKCTNCLLCDKTCITTKRFIINEYIWDNGLMHYICVHNINPDEEFIDKIFKYYIPLNKRINFESRLELKNNAYYLKIDKNQLMILDALMKHGGYTKKYYDTQKRNIFRYSEHAGYFDIRMKNVENIIIQGNTVRVDRGDEEIFLPINSEDTFNYEYIPKQIRCAGCVRANLVQAPLACVGVALYRHGRRC